MSTIFLTTNDGKFLTTEGGVFITIDGYFYPIFMTLSMGLEFGITQSKSFEYDMVTDISAEYNITTSKTGGGL